MPSIFRRRSSSSRSLAAHSAASTPTTQVGGASTPPVRPLPPAAGQSASASRGTSTAGSSVVLVSPPPGGVGAGAASSARDGAAQHEGAFVQDPESMITSASAEAGSRSGSTSIDRERATGASELGKGAPPGRSEGEDARKRKGSLSRTRKRLSSLFRSPSTSSNLAARTGSPSPSPSPQPQAQPALGANGLPATPPPSGGTPRGSISGLPGSKPPPAPSAGAGVGTPSKRGGAPGGPLKVPGNGSAGAGVGVNGNGNGNGDAASAVSSADSGVSGIALPRIGSGAVSGLPRDAVNGHALGAGTAIRSPSSPTAAANTTFAVASDAAPPPPTHGHARTPSLYSEWSTDGYDVDDASDDEVYATPPEGLSEVEEEDNEESEEERRSLGSPRDAVGTGKPNGIDHKANGVARGAGAAAAASDLDAGEPEIHRAIVDTTTSVSSAPLAPSLPAGHIRLTTAEQAAGLAQDIQSCQHVIELFLTSRMKEAERFAYAQDPTGEKMYLQNAAAVIQCIKGMMTFDQNDLSTALEIARGTSALAASLRKPQSGLLGRVAGVVRSGSGTAQIQAMSQLEKHAELVYAESLLIKAVLGIVAGGDWLGLIKEALNMRTAHGIYRQLQAYLDFEAKSGNVKSGIDEHFKSGVELGTGLSSLMLSLMPGKALRVAELFGYAGDRDVALATLMAPGGWSTDASETLPGKGRDVEGVRRPVCDMALLTFHLVIPILMPIGGVNVPLAKNILKWNLERYPNGIFFMYFKSRLHTTQSQPELANDTLQEALDLKLEYLQLQHMCLWDMGVNNMMLCNFSRARSCFEVLTKESNWSKAVYLYSSAACAAELEQQGSKKVSIDAISAAMHEVPKNTRKIAGKSLPIEKYVTRKARKYLGQGNRLMLPGIELGYFFGALSNTPPRILYQTVMPLIRRNIDKLQDSSPEQYGMSESEYWEDSCLAQFLLGVTASFAGYPHAEAVITAKDEGMYTMSSLEAAALSKGCFNFVLSHGSKIHLDHWLVYFTHFELGRLLSQLGDNVSARHHLQTVTSGKAHEVAPNIKGKYSMESALAIKVHAAMQVLKDSDTAKML